MAYRAPHTHKSSAAYNEARDVYGTLSKEQRNRVLDLVSEKTNFHTGEEAEAAFVAAVEQVRKEIACWFIPPCA